MNAQDERFARYDDASPRPNDPVELTRRRFLKALRLLNDTLRDWQNVGACFADGRPICRDPDLIFSPEQIAQMLKGDLPGDDIQFKYDEDNRIVFTAEQAIEDYREFERLALDASDLSRQVPRSETVPKIQLALLKLKPSDVDAVAEVDRLRGREEKAIALMQIAIRQAYEAGGHCLDDLVHEYCVYDGWTEHPECSHTPDFRTVDWYGKRYSFTANQAACVKIWWEQWEKKTGDVGGDYVLEQTNCEGYRIADLFKRHEAWNTMIVSGQTKGTHRLSRPRPEQTRTSEQGENSGHPA